LTAYTQRAAEDGGAHSSGARLRGRDGGVGGGSRSEGGAGADSPARHMSSPAAHTHTAAAAAAAAAAARAGAGADTIKSRILLLRNRSVGAETGTQFSGGGAWGRVGGRGVRLLDSDSGAGAWGGQQAGKAVLRRY
jgi:hypothetical protein